MTIRGWLRSPERFEGHEVYAPPGLRDAVARALTRHAPTSASILDLGSGRPLISRLRTEGFHRITAVARDPALVGSPDEPTPNEPDALTLDLRGAFAAALEDRFDVVVSSEVIEHLPNPRRFLTEASQLVRPDGVLLVTTPNVSNWIGRLRFLLFGELRWFDAARATALNHISPLTDAQMRLALASAGFEVAHADSVGSFTHPVAALLTAPLSLPFVVLHGRKGWGDINLYVAHPRSG